MSYLTFDAESNNRKSFELPGAKPHYNPDRPGQVNHIKLDLSINLQERSFKGTCSITLTPVRAEIQRLELDAAELNIDAVLVQGISQHFDHEGERLTVDLLQPLGENAVEGN